MQQTRGKGDRARLDALADSIAETAAHIDAATHLLLTQIRQFDEAFGWYRQGAVSCAQWLSWRIGLSRGAAREKVRVARALGELPRIDAALRRGELSYSKVRAMTRVATPDNEEILVQMAYASTGAQLEKICRLYRGVQQAESGEGTRDVDERRWATTERTDDGMIRITAQLTVDEAARVMAAIDAAAADVSAGTAGAGDRADGLVALGESYTRGATATSPVEVVVTVERDVLTSGVGVAECGDEPVSAETARRLACDAGVVEATVDSNGNPLDIGRRSRTVPPSIRRALRLRDGGCTFPGCTNDRWVDAHHVQHWGDGGSTRLDNLTSLCSSHHRLVHEQGYAVELTSNGTATFYDEHGRMVTATPPRLRGSATELFQANRSAGLDIDRHTNAPGWDGQTPDYHLCVGALGSRARLRPRVRSTAS